MSSAQHANKALLSSFSARSKYVLSLFTELEPCGICAEAYLLSDKLGIHSLPSCAEGHLLRDDPLFGVVLLRLHLISPGIAAGYPLAAQLGQALTRIHPLHAVSGKLHTGK